jgi:hypothetical protein
MELVLLWQLGQSTASDTEGQRLREQLGSQLEIRK